MARKRLGLRWVLYPTRDENVAAIAANRDALGETSGSRPRTWLRSGTLWDKRETYRLARAVAHPDTANLVPAPRRT